MKKIKKSNLFNNKTVAHYWNKNADLWTFHIKKGFDVYREDFNKPKMLKFM
jgi:hypothetical protein